MNVESVASRATFIAFVEALGDDLRVNHSTPEWENPTLDRFLEALARYTADSEGQVADPPQWRTFAQLLAAAKIYE